MTGACLQLVCDRKGVRMTVACLQLVCDRNGCENDRGILTAGL